VQLGGELVALPFQMPVPVFLLSFEFGAGVGKQGIALIFRRPERLFDHRILVREQLRLLFPVFSFGRLRHSFSRW